MSPIALAMAALLSASVASAALPVGPTDSAATKETRALFFNLEAQMGRGVLFGHQHATIEGKGWRDPADTERSDVKSVSGSFPAVYGWDLTYVFGSPHYPPLKHLKEHIQAAFERGGINTVSWHLDNPVSGGDSWNHTRAVRQILPGGRYHAKFLQSLDQVAEFFATLRSHDGTAIPVIFRPFHETNGPWFWWGRHWASREDYVALFQFTVHYLRDVKQIHNLLYAFSPYWRLISYVPLVGPAVTDYRRDFLDRYPGDEFVDVLGYEQYRGIYPARLSAVVKLALERGKIAAVTETGIEGIPEPDWWTRKFLASLKTNEYTRMAAYALLWRNDVTSPKHHYAPFPGHPSVPDFLEMKRDGAVLFQEDIRDMYQ